MPSFFFRSYVTSVASLPIPVSGCDLVFFASVTERASSACLVKYSEASFSPVPRVASDSKRSRDTFSQRNCEPSTPLLSRLFQEQLPRVAASPDLPSLLDLVPFGTISFNVFDENTLQGSGSFAYAASFTTEPASVAEDDAEAPESFFASSPEPSPESEEQPEATSIIGTAAAPTRMRVSRWRCAGRCMVPSLKTLGVRANGRVLGRPHSVGSEGPRYAERDTGDSGSAQPETPPGSP